MYSCALASFRVTEDVLMSFMTFNYFGYIFKCIRFEVSFLKKKAIDCSILTKNFKLKKKISICSINNLVIILQ